MIPPGLVVGLVVVVSATAVAAEPARQTAYVDEVVVAGGPDLVHGRAHARALLTRAGLRPQFADAESTPCGDDGGCLAQRARAWSATIAVRLTIAEVGDQIMISMLVVDPQGVVRREVVQQDGLASPDPRLTATLRELVPVPRARRSLAPWALVAASAGIALAGGVATWYAHDLRAEFFEQHVAPNGDVFGISPTDARAAERHARRWSVVGGVLLAGAALTGVTATVLFVRGAGEEVRPAGLAVAMELP